MKETSLTKLQANSSCLNLFFPSQNIKKMLFIIHSKYFAVSLAQIPRLILYNKRRPALTKFVDASNILSIQWYLCLETRQLGQSKLKKLAFITLRKRNS